MQIATQLCQMAYYKCARHFGLDRTVASQNERELSFKKFVLVSCCNISRSKTKFIDVDGAQAKEQCGRLAANRSSWFTSRFV